MRKGRRRGEKGREEGEERREEKEGRGESVWLLFCLGAIYQCLCPHNCLPACLPACLFILVPVSQDQTFGQMVGGPRNYYAFELFLEIREVGEVFRVYNRGGEGRGRGGGGGRVREKEVGKGAIW